jgi:hypothetical protein
MKGILRGKNGFFLNSPETEEGKNYSMPFLKDLNDRL